MVPEVAFTAGAFSFLLVLLVFVLLFGEAGFTRSLAGMCAMGAPFPSSDDTELDGAVD